MRTRKHTVFGWSCIDISNIHSDYKCYSCINTSNLSFPHCRNNNFWCYQIHSWPFTRSLVYSENPDDNFVKYWFLLCHCCRWKTTLHWNCLRTLRNVCGSLKCVVGIISGRSLAIEPYLPLVDVAIAAWLPGAEDQGVADSSLRRLFVSQARFHVPGSSLHANFPWILEMCTVIRYFHLALVWQPRLQWGRFNSNISGHNSFVNLLFWLLIFASSMSSSSASMVSTSASSAAAARSQALVVYAFLSLTLSWVFADLLPF